MKRIISLFLAVVMITSITAGIDFTAQAKTRDEYFADFDGRVSGLIAELAPTLAGVKYNKSDIIPGYDGKISDYYYSYLDGTEEDKLDFYQLYQLCKENKDAEGEFGECCADIYDELNMLLGLFGEKATAYQNNYEAAIGFVMEYAEWLAENGYDVSGISKAELDEVVYTPTGVSFKDAKADTDVKPSSTNTDNIGFALKYLKSLFPQDTSIKFTSLSDCIYYMMSDYGYKTFLTELYLDIIDAGEGKVTTVISDEEKTVTLNNYKDIAKELFAFEDYCIEYLDFGPADWTIEEGDTPYQKAEKNALKAKAEGMYDSFLPSVIYSTVLVEDYGHEAFDLCNDNYCFACAGVLVQSGIFASAEDTYEYLSSQVVKQEQVEALIDYATANNWNANFNLLVNYLDSSDNTFSETATAYIKDSLQSDATRSATAALCEALNGASYDEISKFVVDDGTYHLGDIPFFERVSYMVPAEIILEYTGNSALISSAITDSANPLTAFTMFNEYTSFIRPAIDKAVKSYVQDKYSEDSSVAYKYSRYDDALSKYLVELANENVNNAIGSVFDKTSMTGIILSGVINSLMETEVTIYDKKGNGLLNDILLKLYNNPTDTIVESAPALVAVLDELVIPLIFNAKGDAYNGILYQFLSLDSSSLYKYTQAAGDTTVGIGSMSFDLNTIVPAALYWMSGDSESALELVGRYEAPYDNHVVQFTNVYAIDKFLTETSISEETGEVLIKAVNKYLEEHKDDARTDKNGNTLQKGMNNIFVAFPQIADNVLDILENEKGKEEIAGYRFNSVETVDGKQVNTFIQGLKALNGAGSDEIFNYFDANYVKYQRALSALICGTPDKTYSEVTSYALETMLANTPYEHLLGDDNVLVMFAKAYDDYYMDKTGYDPTHKHTALPAEKKNEVEADCTNGGSYDEYVYCKDCGEEISHKHITTDPLGHTPGAAKKENVVAATYEKGGSYDEVVYCTVCKKEISRTHHTTSPLKRTSITKTTITGITKKTYTGKRITQKITVKYNGKTLKSGVDYTVTYSNNINAGTATVKIVGKGAYKDTVKKSFRIEKASNPMVVKTKTVTLKESELKKREQSVAKTKAFEITKAKGRISFEKLEGKSGVSINQTGTIKVKKGTKKGTYALKIRVKAAGDKNYKSLSKSVTVRIVVK